ncbi:MerR family transcriptional regulator [Alteribacillus sp. JSM 102045]|uniref:helix-turn-helix domain-containing protein n=1 Tax=Alteribacillus sp. JSM 102045 TaxID=1562101 RepID=UPI0035C1E60C
MSKNENISQDKMDEKLSKPRLTVKEAAASIDESPSVLRNWMRELKTYIPTKQGENGYHYFDKEALEQIQLIKKMNREQGYSIKQIEYHLATDGEYIKPAKLPDTTEKLMDEIKALHEKMDKQEEFNRQLVEQLEQQNQYIKNSVQERDQKLLETLNEIKSQKEEKRKGGFLTRLFAKE